MAEGGKKDAAYIASNVISVVKHFVLKMLFKFLWMALIRQNGS